MPTLMMIWADMQMVIPEGFNPKDGHCHFVQTHERGVLRRHARFLSIDGTPMDPRLFSRHSAEMVLEKKIREGEISVEDEDGLQTEIEGAHLWLPNYVEVIPDDEEEETIRGLFPPRYARAMAES